MFERETHMPNLGQPTIAPGATGEDFDLIELNGDDLRRDPLDVRKATLASLLARVAAGIRFNDHMEEVDGPTVFQHACKLGLEGIVSRPDKPLGTRGAVMADTVGAAKA
jgi:bifunctional non-homologous end joining protein LigD